MGFETHEKFVKNDIETVENDAAKNWQLITMKTIIIDPKSEKELDNTWQKWKEMKKQDRRQSDWKSMELYGKDNTTRYEELKRKYNDTAITNQDIKSEYTPNPNPVKEQAEDDMIDFNDISYPEENIKYAEDWQFNSMYYIIKPRETLDKLEDDWLNYTSMVARKRRLSDDKSIELFGVDNKTHYEFLKSKFLKQDIDDTKPQKDINIDQENIESEDNNAIPIFAEALCNRIKESNDYVQISEDCIKLMSLQDTSLYENVLIQSTLDGTIEMFKDNICNIDNSYTKGDLPFYTPSELSDFGVYSGELNKFSPTPDNDNIGDEIRTNVWFKNYQMLFNGVYTENNNKYTSLWIDRLNKLYLDYGRIKESGDINKINARKQSILELGWNPNLEFNLKNRIKASERVLGILKEQYKDTQILDITKFVESHNEVEILTENEETPHNLKPIFVVFLKSDTIFNKVVSTVTKSPYGHVSIGFNPTLKTLYSYSVKNDGFSQESIERYKDVVNLKVFCVFVQKNKISKLRANIREIMNNKKDADYSFMNLITMPLNIDYKSNIDMVCSQFVDSMLKLADLDFTKKSSGLVTPKDIYRNMHRKKTVYKIYDGIIKKYNPKKVNDFIKNIYENLNSIKESTYISNKYKPIYENVFKPYIEIQCIDEAKEFPIQFDEDGNLLIQRMNRLDFESEYAKSHKLLLSYEKADNIEGIKYELCKLWFMNILIEKKLYNKETSKEEIQSLHKARAKILNDFNKYIDYVSSKESNFNFIEYYNDTPFNDSKIKINAGTLKYTMKYIKSMLSIK